MKKALFTLFTYLLLSNTALSASFTFVDSIPCIIGYGVAYIVTDKDANKSLEIGSAVCAANVISKLVTYNKMNKERKEIAYDKKLENSLKLMIDSKIKENNEMLKKVNNKNERRYAIYRTIIREIVSNKMNMMNKKVRITSKQIARTNSKVDAIMRKLSNSKEIQKQINSVIDQKSDGNFEEIERLKSTVRSILSKDKSLKFFMNDSGQKLD